MMDLNLIKKLSIFIINFAISSYAFCELVGNDRLLWEKGYIPACIHIQTKNELNKKFTINEIKIFCECSSSYIAERATAYDVNNTSQNLRKIIDNAGIQCAGRALINR